MTVLGDWEFASAIEGGQGKVYVHIPDTGANTTDATYQVVTKFGTFDKTVSQDANESNSWVSLGGYRFGDTPPEVRLSNTTGDGTGDDDVAWDAVAVVPGDFSGMPEVDFATENPDAPDVDDIASQTPEDAPAPTDEALSAVTAKNTAQDTDAGYRRIHGELLVLGVQVAASTVREILKDAGIDPAPERAVTTWAGFLGSQAEALPACDFFETITLTGTRLYVFAVIGHAGRRIRIPGATAHPTASWVAQAARNLVMDFEDAGCRARFLIRDRDGKYPALFDTVLEDAGIKVVLSGIRIPRMNALMERWVQTCRRELLDRTQVWNQHHILHALREFRAALQLPPAPPGHRRRPPAAPPATADHRPGRHRPPRHTTT